MSKSRDCTSPRSQRDTCGGNNRAGGSKSCSSSREALNSRGNGGRVCPGTGHSERKSKKSKDNNMLLLLHQKDAENFGIQGGCGEDCILFFIACFWRIMRLMEFWFFFFFL